MQENQAQGVLATLFQMGAFWKVLSSGVVYVRGCVIYVYLGIYGGGGVRGDYTCWLYAASVYSL